MFAASKIKWFGSVILAGTLLVVALFGGKWGTVYTAEAGDCPAPNIVTLTPSSVPAGSPDTTLIITGSNFGDITDTRARISGVGVDALLPTLVVLPDGLSATITDTLLVAPAWFLVTVVKSCPHTVPILPIDPAWDVTSNPLTFSVYGASQILLPIITNNALH